jgi:uncharacterized membrane protein (DUF106 family)
MSPVNAALRVLFDVLNAPFRGLPAMVGVVVWSLVAAVAMLVVFKHTSNQERIAAVKARIHACLFEIRLFNDDLAAIFRAQFEILRHNLVYLSLSVKPMLWMIVPLVLVIAHLQFHYGYHALQPGDRTILKLTLAEDWPERLGVDAAGNPARPPIELRVPDGLKRETPGVWVPSLGEMTWRLAASSWGDYQVEIAVGDQTYSKAVRVSEDLVRLSPVRPSTGFLSQLTWPAEAPLPAHGVVREISVEYPAGEIGLLGWHMQWEYAWMAAFFVLSIIFAFVLRKRFGVTI